MIAYILVYILVAALFLPLLSRLTGLLKKKAVFSKELLKKMLKFGVPLTFGGLGGIILLYTDTLVLTYFRSLEEVGIYNVVVPTAMMLAFFAIAVSQVIFPMGSELWALGMKKMLAKGIEILQKYSFLIIIPCVLAMFSFSELILRLLFGEAYVSGSLALQILVIGIIFLVVGSINLTLIESFGKPVIGANILLIGAAVNFLLNLLLIPKFGMAGAAFTSLLGYFLIFLLSTIMLKKLVTVRFPWLALIKIVIASAVFLFAIFYLKSILSLNAYLEAGVCLAMASIVYLALLLVLRVISIKEIKELYS
jgi:stage V sporulation protein B